MARPARGKGLDPLNAQQRSATRAIAEAVELHEQGQFALAEAQYRRILASMPTQFVVIRNLGVLLLQTARAGEAIILLEAAVKARPKHAATLEALADFYQQVGDEEKAFAALLNASRVVPESPAIQYKIGLSFERRRLAHRAVEHFRLAARLMPSSSEYHYRLAGALRETGQFAEAVFSYEQALSLAPNAVEVLLDFAGTLRLLGRDKEAIAHYEKAGKLRPELGLVHNNLGNALLDLGRFDDALSCLERAARLEPAMALGNLGSAYLEVGRLNEAIRAFRSAVALAPNDQVAHSSLVFSLPFHPGYDQASVLREARSCCQKLESAVPRPESPIRQKSPERRLRIGYLSPDFREHCQSMFTLPLLRNHDATSVEIYCYSGVLQPDAVTTQLRACAQHWRDIGLMSDGAVANAIRADGIDILVDLTMHMARHRLAVLAERPAPLQVTWLAYPGTTGSSRIDYRLSDPYLDPADSDLRLYTETTYRLPRTFWCYDPMSAGPSPGPLPALSSGMTTFGCLNAFRKVNHEVIAVFARVLESNELSRLVLLCPPGESRVRVLREFAEQGIGTPRILFADRLPRAEYLNTYREIDICLDTFPYNGHTTSLDAWWMGVPVVTLVGRTIVGRAGLSQAANLGLTELVASTPDEYVRIATQLAQDVERLSALRRGLRQRMEQSPLMDAAAFARDIESAYRSFWRRYCGNARAGIAGPESRASSVAEGST